MPTIKETSQYSMDTGEQLSSKKEIIRFKKVDTEQFIIIYLDMTIELMNELSPVDIRVLHCLWKSCLYSQEKQGNIVHTGAFYKKQWSELIGSKVSTIGNSLTNLEKKGMIAKIGTSVYVLNPSYFFKGERNSRFGLIEDLAETFNKTENTNTQPE